MSIYLGNDYEFIKDKVDLGEILISADVNYVEKYDESFESDDEKNIFIKISTAKGEKCPRCWKYFNNLNLF